MSILLLTSIAVILRVLSNPVANVFQKRLTNNGQHPLAVNFLTYLVLSLLCGVLALYTPWSKLPPSFWLYSALGGIAGALGNGFLVKALEKGDLSVLGPINAYKSVVGLLLGIILLGEVPGVWGTLGTALIIGGSYFILDTFEERFSFALLRRKELRYRLWAMMLTGIEAVFIKKVVLASDVSTAFLSWCWFGALFSFLLLRFSVVKPVLNRQCLRTGNLRSYIFLFLCIGTMQLTTNFVFTHMPVGYALALFQLSTLVSVGLGYRIFREENIFKKLVGSAIMLIGSVVIILLK